MSSEQIITEGFGLDSPDFILTMGFGDGPPVVPDGPTLALPDMLVLDYTGDLRMILEDGEGGVAVVQNDLERDAGIETAVILSMFTDKRVSKDEELPDDSGDRRGWWGDVTQSDQIGSKLWLLGRSKMSPLTYQLFETYAEESLQWMLEDGVVKSAKVTVTPSDEEGISFEVALVRPENGQSIRFRYFYNWEAQIFRRT